MGPEHSRLGHRVGTLAVERGWVSPRDLEAAVAEQDREAADATPRPLGVILVARGALTDVQLTTLLQETRVRTPDTRTALGYDGRLGRQLVEGRQVTAEQLEECLRAQEAILRSGRRPVPRLGELLVERGHTTPDAIRRALASQQKTLLECAACRKRYNVLRYDPTRIYACLGCGEILAPRRDIDAVGVHASGDFPSVALEASRGAGDPAAAPPADAPPATPPETLGKYTIVREIGHGGMGTIYEAVLSGAMGFEKTVAIKTIREDFSSNADFVERFINEAKLVADLVHQNIGQVYQLDRIGGCYYLVMEYVAGVNLMEFMERHLERKLRVPIDLGTFIVSRVCRALEYAHAKRDKRGRRLGIVHRDVSPKNILLSTEGEVKLTDFGVAKAMNRSQDLEGELIVGKAQYMSPEQAQYRPTDARSDVFSLGIVTYELLAGQQLFDAESTAATLQNVTHRHIPPPRVFRSDLPPELERIMVRATQRDPAARYAAAGEMGHDLEQTIYQKGYGPTIVALEKYMRSLFPELYRAVEEPPAAP